MIKKLGLVLLILLIVSSQADNQDDFMTKYQRIEKSKYGKALLNTIQLQLSSEGPVEDLIKMLQESEHDLQDEQRQDDEFIGSLQDVCDDDLARLDSEIEAANQRIKDLTAEIAEKTPIRDEKIKTRDEKVQFREQLQQRIVEIDEAKTLRDSEWEEELAQHDSAQYIIEKAKSIISQSLKGSSFLQSNGATIMAQVSQHFKQNTKQSFKRKSWNHIFNLLSQITASAPVQADQSIVGKVIDLCDKLIGKISESREIERRDYNHFVSEYNTVKADLQDKVSTLTDEINELDNSIDILTKRINAATAENHDTQVRRDQKTEERNERFQYCENENDNYSQRRQSRHDEIEVVSDAVALLQSNQRLFRSYVNDRLTGIAKPERINQ